MVEFRGNKIEAANDNFELKVGDFVTVSNPSWHGWRDKHFGKGATLRIANITGRTVTVVNSRDYKPDLEIPNTMRDPRFKDYTNLKRHSLQIWEVRKLPIQVMDSDEPKK